MSKSATHTLHRLSKPFEELLRELRFAASLGGTFLFNTQSPGTVVGTLTTLPGLDDTGVETRKVQVTFLFPKTPRQSL